MKFIKVTFETLESIGHGGARENDIVRTFFVTREELLSTRFVNVLCERTTHEAGKFWEAVVLAGLIDG